MQTILKGMGQVALFCLLSVFSSYLTKQFHLALPGSIVGIFILFFLLQTNILQLEWVELGANFLLAELLLFFIPSAVGIMKYQSLLLTDGPQILLAIISGTIIVMACAGLFANKLFEARSKNL